MENENENMTKEEQQELIDEQYRSIKELEARLSQLQHFAKMQEEEVRRTISIDEAFEAAFHRQFDNCVTEFDLVCEPQLNEHIEEVLRDTDMMRTFLDYDDIRYAIETDILTQVDDYVDCDTIRYEIEDDILGQVNDHIDWSNAEYEIDSASLFSAALDNICDSGKQDIANLINELIEMGLLNLAPNAAPNAAPPVSPAFGDIDSLRNSMAWLNMYLTSLEASE